MNINNLAIIVALFLTLTPTLSFAEHKSAVAGQVVNSDDANISQGTECDGKAHYHNELNGVADPAPTGCGHGEVTKIVHGNGDGETLPATPAKKGFWASVGDFFSNLFSEETEETIGNVVDVAAEANGVIPPNQTTEIVDIVVEQTPQIMEKAEGIKEYRDSVDPEDDTLGIYNNLNDVPENPTVSQRFFKWFNNLIP